MKRLGYNIEQLIAGLTGDSDQAYINLRAHQVRARYKQAIQSVYRQTAQLFLEHTNNVYIMKKDGLNTLIVYVDDSIYAAELNAQRELIKLKLLELFGEQIETFEIKVSRQSYKDKHPFTDEVNIEEANVSPLPPLDEEGRRYVYKTAEKVEDEKLRKSLEKAMTADIARNRAENGSAS